MSASIDRVIDPGGFAPVAVSRVRARSFRPMRHGPRRLRLIPLRHGSRRPRQRLGGQPGMSPRSARPMTARPPRPCAWAASIASGRARPRECGGPSHRSSGQSHGLTVSAPRSVRRCDERLSSASGPCQSSFAAPRPWPRRTAVHVGAVRPANAVNGPTSSASGPCPRASGVELHSGFASAAVERPACPSRRSSGRPQGLTVNAWRASIRLAMRRTAVERMAVSVLALARARPRSHRAVSVSPVERTASGPHRQRVARLDPCACTPSIASSRVCVTRSSGSLTVSLSARGAPRSVRVHALDRIEPCLCHPVERTASRPRRQRVARLDPCACTPSIASSRVCATRSSGQPHGLTVSAPRSVRRCASRSRARGSSVFPPLDRALSDMPQCRKPAILPRYLSHLHAHKYL